MIDKETARAIAQAELDKPSPYQTDPIELALYEEAVELEYGWLFSFNTKQCIDTGNIDYGVVGSGPILVLKEDGKLFHFGSGEFFKCIEGFDAGFRLRVGKLTILHVFDLDKTAYFLLKLGMYYVIPEFEHGVEWRIAQPYTSEQFHNALEKLPAVFERVYIAINYEAFLEMDSSKCCEYKIEPMDEEA